MSTGVPLSQHMRTLEARIGGVEATDVGVPMSHGHLRFEGRLQIEVDLERERLPGGRFRPLFFRPTFHKHAGEACGGVQVHSRRGWPR